MSVPPGGMGGRAPHVNIRRGGYSLNRLSRRHCPHCHVTGTISATFSATSRACNASRSRKVGDLLSDGRLLTMVCRSVQSVAKSIPGCQSREPKQDRCRWLPTEFPGGDWDPARTAAGIMNWPDERDLFEQSPDAPDGLLVPELRHHDGELAGERDFGLAHAGASRQPRSPALHGRTLDWPGEAGPGGPHGPGPAQCVHAQIENIIALLPVKCAPSRLQLRRDCRSSKHSHSCVLRKDRDSPGPTTDHFVMPGNMNRP
jgi:hypothetical protein